MEQFPQFQILVCSPGDSAKSTAKNLEEIKTTLRWKQAWDHFFLTFYFVFGFSH